MEKRDNYKYLISITGKNINFQCPIFSLSDLEDVENILKILKEKFQKS